MTKVLVVLTNTERFPSNGEATGLWLSEATEFVDEMQKAGYEVDYVSPKGGQVPIDPRSLKSRYLDENALSIYRSYDFQERALKHSLKPSQINPLEYRAIYFTGGHGVVFDFPENEDLQAISAAIFQNQGYVTAVCHGVVGLLNVKNSDGSYLIAGKTMTGFSQLEEILSGKSRLVPFSTEKEIKKRGADYRKKRPFSSYAILDGRLITGQNPMSGRAVGQYLLEALEEE